MKKYSIFHVIFLLMVTLHTGAMELEIKQDPSIPNSDIYCLLKMPVDICNYIATLLLWESDEELRTRTMIKKEVMVTDYYQYFDKGVLGCSETECFRVLSPDGSKYATLNVFSFDLAVPEVTIIDLDSKKIMQKATLENHQYECLALSLSGTVIATIHKKIEDLREPIEDRYPYVMTVQKVAQKEKRTFKITGLKEPFTIDFNMQGTNVIVCGTDYTHNKQCKKYMLCSLKNDSLKEVIEAVEKPNKLHDYFRYNRVCKALQEPKK